MIRKFHNFSIQINKSSITVLITILSSVFGAGYYIGWQLSEIKSNDKNMELRLQLLDLKMEYSEREYKLRNELMQFKIDVLNKYNHEK